VILANSLAAHQGANLQHVMLEFTAENEGGNWNNGDVPMVPIYTNGVITGWTVSSESGVTFGAGIDLGSQTVARLLAMGVQQSIVNQIPSNLYGLKGLAAATAIGVMIQNDLDAPNSILARTPPSVTGL